MVSITQYGKSYSLKPDTTDSAIPVEYPITGYSEKADASANQSFISADGTEWNDLTKESGWEKANVCIKAFGTPGTGGGGGGGGDTGGSSGCSTGPVMLILLGLGVLPLVYKGRKQ